MTQSTVAEDKSAAAYWPVMSIAATGQGEQATAELPGAGQYFVKLKSVSTERS
jgi:hypothetical protein